MARRDGDELLRAYVDAYRDAVVRRIDGLRDDELRRPVLPSGWTPLELVRHLTYVEQRWLFWTFRGEAMDGPWGDEDPTTGRWVIPPGLSTATVLTDYAATCRRARDELAGCRLDEVARHGTRYGSDDPVPNLRWILFHLLQEYARHLGHLDVVRELIDGQTGE